MHGAKSDFIHMYLTYMYKFSCLILCTYTWGYESRLSQYMLFSSCIMNYFCRLWLTVLTTHIDGLVQYYSICNTLDILQCCTKSSIYGIVFQIMYNSFPHPILDNFAMTSISNMTNQMLSVGNLIYTYEYKEGSEPQAETLWYHTSRPIFTNFIGFQPHNYCTRPTYVIMMAYAVLTS